MANLSVGQNHKQEKQQAEDLKNSNVGTNQSWSPNTEVGARVSWQKEFAEKRANLEDATNDAVNNNNNNSTRVGLETNLTKSAYLETSVTVNNLSSADQRVLDGIATSHDPALAILRDKLAANPEYIRFFRDKWGDAIGTYANKNDDLLNKINISKEQLANLTENRHLRDFIKGLEDPATYLKVDHQRRSLPRDFREAFSLVRDLKNAERELRTIKRQEDKIAGREQLAMIKKLVNSGRAPGLEEKFDPSIEIGGPNSFSRNSQNPYVSTASLKPAMDTIRQDEEDRVVRQVASLNPTSSPERVEALKTIQRWRSGADVRIPGQGSYKQTQAIINSIDTGSANTGAPGDSIRMSVVGVGVEGIKTINEQTENIYRAGVNARDQLFNERIASSVDNGDIKQEQGKLIIDLSEFTRTLEVQGNSKTQFAAWQKAQGLFVENITARAGDTAAEAYVKELFSSEFGNNLTSDEKVLRQMARDLINKQREIFESAINTELSNGNAAKATNLITYLKSTHFVAAMSSEEIQVLENKIKNYVKPAANPFDDSNDPFAANTFLSPNQFQTVAVQNPSQSIEVKAGSYGASGFKLNIAGREIKVDQNKVAKITNSEPLLGEGFSISKASGTNNYTVKFYEPGQHYVAVKIGNIYQTEQSIRINTVSRQLAI